MMKSKREQELELELENKKLKEKIKALELEKKTLKLKLKIQSEQLDDIQKENKTVFYRNKYQLEKEKNKNLEAELKNKIDYIANVLGQLHKNSSNSSKPSSTDGFKKVIHNNKKASTKDVGGQFGHKYHEPKLVKEVDNIVKLKKTRKCECG